MSDYRVIERRQCKCGQTEVSTQVLVQIVAGEAAPDLKAPAVPEVTCEMCQTLCDQEIMRK